MCPAKATSRDVKGKVQNTVTGNYAINSTKKKLVSQPKAVSGLLKPKNWHRIMDPDCC